MTDPIRELAEEIVCVVHGIYDDAMNFSDAEDRVVRILRENNVTIGATKTPIAGSPQSEVNPQFTSHIVEHSVTVGGEQAGPLDDSSSGERSGSGDTPRTAPATPRCKHCGHPRRFHRSWDQCPGYEPEEE